MKEYIVFSDRTDAKAHLESEEEGEADRTLCGKEIPARWSRSGADTCARCDARAEKLEAPR